MKKPYFIEEAYKAGRTGGQWTERVGWPVNTPEYRAFKRARKNLPMLPLEQLL